MPCVDTGPTADPSRFRGPGEPYAGHWRKSPASWQSLEQQMPAGEMPCRLPTRSPGCPIIRPGPATRRRAEMKRVTVALAIC